MIELKLKDKFEKDAHKSNDNLLKSNYKLEGTRSTDSGLKINMMGIYKQYFKYIYADSYKIRR